MNLPLAVSSSFGPPASPTWRILPSTRSTPERKETYSVPDATLPTNPIPTTPITHTRREGQRGETNGTSLAELDKVKQRGQTESAGGHRFEKGQVLGEHSTALIEQRRHSPRSC